MSTSGGENLRRHIREARANAAEVQVDVGFKGRVATLASQHEYGNPRIGLPERPAIRASVRDLEAAIVEAAATDHDEIVEVANEMRDIVKKSYLNFEGAPLSARQTERKSGTPYASDQLIGGEGPKLVSHVSVWVNDDEV